MKNLIIAFFALLTLGCYGQPTDAQRTATITLLKTHTDGQNTKTFVGGLFDQFNQGKVSRTEALATAGTNTYTVSADASITGLTKSFQLFLRFPNANTGASTLDVNSLGAVALKNNDGTALTSATIKAASYHWVVYDVAANVFKLAESVGGSGGGGTWGSITGTLSSQTDLQSALDLKANLISPALVTPNIGTPSAGVLTNTTGLPLSSGVIGQLPLTNGGTSVNLSDPGADRIWGWDDTDNSIGFWTLGSGLTYTHSTHTLSATGGSVTSITATSPLTGGVITTTGSIGIQDAAADGSTKGAATYAASDFNASSGNISIDYTNGQAASGSTKGFLTSANWTTFNNKLSALSNGNGTTANGTAIDLGGFTSGDITLINGGLATAAFSFTDGLDYYGSMDTRSLTDWYGGVVGTNQITFSASGTTIDKAISETSDQSAFYTNLSLTNKGYVDAKLAGKNITAPAVGQNGQAIRWNNSTPAWEYFTPTTVTPAALTKTDDTNVTLTLGGTPATALLQNASITAGWTGTLAYSRFVNGTGLSVVGRSANTSGVQADIVGTANQVLRVSGTTLAFGAVDLAAMVGATVLPVANGGTNIASYAVGDLLYASAGTTLSKLADVAAGSYLRSGGVTTAFVWSTTTLPNSATTGDIMYASGANTYANRAAVATGSVLGSAGTSTAPAYLAVSNGLTATATTLKWGGSLTAATNVTGSATNTLTYQFDAMGTTVTNGAGIYFKNTTAATNGAQQISPITTWEGRGFGTTGSVNQAVAYSMYVLPVQGTTNPSGVLNLGYSVNGAALTTGMAMTTAGKTTFTGTTEGVNVDITNGAGNVWERYTSSAGANVYGHYELQSNEFRYVGDAAGFKYGLTSVSIATTQTVNPTSFIPAVQHTFGNHTGMTLNTPFPMFQINTGTLTWADGTVASQSLYKMLTPTYNGTTTLATFTEAATLQVDAPTAGAKAAFTNGGYSIYSNGGIRVDGNVRLGTVGNKILLKEGSGGFMGQTTLVSGTKAVTVSGVTTSTRCFPSLVTPSGVSLTVNYQCVCTANTVTLQANVAAGSINTSDGSTLNYILFEPAP